jgi:2-desacetyl-2-hydroxyethyl bacteriochlorophyllide A dehydrogenase
MKARCIVMNGKHHVEVREFNLPEPGDKEVMVEVIHSVISPGTELRCYDGGQADARFSEFIPGYAAQGRIIKKGCDCVIKEGAIVNIGGTQKSDIATMWGGHVSHAIVSECSILPVPGGLDLMNANMARLGAIAFHGYKLARPVAGERVVVVGLGMIGQCSARLFSMSGARTLCLDLSEFRISTASKAGCEARLVKGTLKDTIKDVFPEGVDIIVDTTGSPRVMEQAVELGIELPWDGLQRRGCRYVVQGSYPGSFSIPYQNAFMKEMTFILPRDKTADDPVSVMGLLAAKKLSLAECITKVRKPEEAKAVYDELMDRNAPLITEAFQWSTE